jgi:F-type H+-transporting ATPase subunit epsilon
MPETFVLEIYTPRRLFCSERVEEVIVRLSDGECGILKGHTLFTASIVPCIARIKKENGNWTEAFLTEGIIEVKQRKTIILSECAEKPEEIDTERAQKAKAEALLRLKENSGDTETAKHKLQKAELRLKLAEKSRSG